MTPSPAIDVHQHLWPPELIDALRARQHPPRLDGWTLLLDGEPPYDVTPDDHLTTARRALDGGRIVLGLSSPLGIEDLPADEGAPLLDAWHDGAAALRPDFDAWVSVNRQDPDLDGAAKLLADGFVGAADAGHLAVDPGKSGATGATCLRLRRPRTDRSSFTPVLSHRSADPDDVRPSWWAAVVDYPSQMLAAWWSWHAVGRSLFPDLRICFAAGAGLAPVHHERFLARGGRPLVVDQNTFVDTSSYSRQGVDSLIRVLGVDPIVIGSDRPYGRPFVTDQGDALDQAFRHTNPLRLLEGTRS